MPQKRKRKNLLIDIIYAPVAFHGGLIIAVGLALFAIDRFYAASWRASSFDHDQFTAMIVLAGALFLLLSERLLRDKVAIAQKMGEPYRRDESDAPLRVRFNGLYKHIRSLYHFSMMSFLFFYIAIHVPPVLSRKNVIVFEIEVLYTALLLLEFFRCYTETILLSRALISSAMRAGGDGSLHARHQEQWPRSRLVRLSSGLRLLQGTTLLAGPVLMFFTPLTSTGVVSGGYARWLADTALVALGAIYLGIDLHHARFLQSLLNVKPESWQRA